MKNSPHKTFGTDGIRGRVGVSPMTPDILVLLGVAIGQVLNLKSNGTNEVLIGKDTRLSGYMIESALEAGLSAAGIDVILSGPLPTSAVSYLTQALRLRAGVMISASHNPYYDNGLKFFDANGHKLSDNIEAKIEKIISKTNINFSQSPGKARRLDDAAGRYIEFCKSTFPSDLDLYGLKIVVDCANGAAYNIAASVFHELGAEVVLIGAEPDGVNINVRCGVLAPKAACSAVKEHQADLGVILDGDADRVMLVDSSGKLFNGDALLYAIAMDEISMGNRPVGVVGTKISNFALEVALKKVGIGFVRSDVGDRHVFEMLKSKGWLLGGEPSGHILLRDRHNSGDGIISALRLLEGMRRRKKSSLAELFGGYKPFPQAVRNVPVRNKHVTIKSRDLKSAIASAEQALGEDGRVIVRASGTEPLVRVVVESPARRLAEAIADEIVQCCMPRIG